MYGHSFTASVNAALVTHRLNFFLSVDVMGCGGMFEEWRAIWGGRGERRDGRVITNVKTDHRSRAIDR